MIKDCHVIDEESANFKKVASYESVAECERRIAELERTEAAKVHRGGFGIDAPEHKVNPGGARK